jgi:hypothetical protein
LMGLPGPAKSRLCNGDLSSIWTAATAALTAADEIVFIGYRFPPSDSQSRSLLLKAIATNQGRGGGTLIAGERWLKIHTVLGLQSPQSQRLGQLLNAAKPGSVRQHQLFAEDFLSMTGPLSPCNGP